MCLLAASAAVVVLTLTAAGPASAATGCPDAGAPPQALTIARYNASLLCLLNAERGAAGAPPLTERAKLDGAARSHSRSMKKRHYFDHTSPRGAGVHSRIARTGYLRHAGNWSIGENLGAGSSIAATPAAVIAAWMGSAEHRTNILDATFSDIGIGTVRGEPLRSARKSGVTITTDFGSRSG